MPYKVWAVGEEVLAADFNDYVQEQVVPTFATAAARDAAYLSPPNGALAVTLDTNTLWQRIAGAWVSRAAEAARMGTNILAGSWAGTETVLPLSTPPVINLPYPHRVRWWVQLTPGIASIGTVDLKVRYNTTGAAGGVGDTLARSCRATFQSQTTMHAEGALDRPAGGSSTWSLWSLTSGPTATIVLDPTLNQMDVWAVAL